MNYIGQYSDLDLVWTLPRRYQINTFLAELVKVEFCAPMRLDGELVGEDGAGVNWRELHAGGAECVVKSATGVVLCSRETFVGNSA
jgi:phosphoribosyl-dephospho-CoA transferase